MSDIHKRKRSNSQTLFFARKLRGIKANEAAQAVGLSTTALKRYEDDFGVAPLCVVLSLFRFYDIPYK
ncbi:helix-turn-helix transcriptional regulator [Paenibacillus kribbensis]|uniref:helix-turn-helix domain-containing protein n=1 Tax=Paenibacillus kribbensis TaxID=172713 RepID=UPI002DBD25E5|nr:helix-turn-helix transcriptional regulator [Paenibacillus kribbensis]MEC0233624.1 helix-turn-helix transcriptional regulator [Paenibacillus kribbensis]